MEPRCTGDPRTCKALTCARKRFVCSDLQHTYDWSQTSQVPLVVSSIQIHSKCQSVGFGMEDDLMIFAPFNCAGDGSQTCIASSRLHTDSFLNSQEFRCHTLECWNFAVRCNTFESWRFAAVFSDCPLIWFHFDVMLSCLFFNFQQFKTVFRNGAPIGKHGAKTWAWRNRADWRKVRDDSRCCQGFDGWCWQVVWISSLRWSHDY